MAQPEAKPLTRQETAARNRERLLDAAARVIQRSGLGGASLEDIAADASLTTVHARDCTPRRAAESHRMQKFLGSQ